MRLSYPILEAFPGFHPGLFSDAPYGSGQLAGAGIQARPNEPVPTVSPRTIFLSSLR